MNDILARDVVGKLLQMGVREFCLCAGARNAPLVSQLEMTEGVKLFSFFEERSASFFALGRIRESGNPVAVVTTSGTAVAECLSGVIEANYQGLPLLVLSADRPREYRMTGAPQSIEQVGIFGSYVEKCWDFVIGDLIDLTRVSWRRPLHLNVCFEEPKNTEVYEHLALEPLEGENFFSEHQPEKAPFLLQDALVLVGPLLEHEKEPVQVFLERCPFPFVLEGPSSLQLSAEALQRRIWCPEKTLPRAFQKGWLSSVLRLGGVPTLRFWRDLEEKLKQIPVFSCSSLPYSGLARPSLHLIGMENLAEMKFADKPEFSFVEDRASFERLKMLLEKYPRSEAAMVREFALRAKNEQVYLGNSLPIREWDLVAGDLSVPQVWANRGANGIDGQISSFLGWTCQKGESAWALLGDLTALYDLASLWITPQLQERNRRIVIINNFGGQIFRQMFQKEIFLNRHQVQFQKWAEMWNWNYACSEDAGIFKQDLGSRQIIELRPEEKSTDQFNQEWRAF